MGHDVSKMITQVQRRAIMQGWRVEIGGSHLKFFAPNGVDLIVAPKTSRSSSGFRNFMARMRRAGYQEQI